MTGPGSWHRPVGVALIVLGVLGALWSALAALLTANPCGAFGDACEDVGGTGNGFGWFVIGIVGFVIVAVVGVALIGTTRSTD